MCQLKRVELVGVVGIEAPWGQPLPLPLPPLLLLLLLNSPLLGAHAQPWGTMAPVCAWQGVVVGRGEGEGWLLAKWVGWVPPLPTPTTCTYLPPVWAQ